MAKLKLDLHDIYNRGDQIETELNRVIQEAKWPVEKTSPALSQPTPYSRSGSPS